MRRWRKRCRANRRRFFRTLGAHALRKWWTATVPIWSFTVTLITVPRRARPLQGSQFTTLRFLSFKVRSLLLYSEHSKFKVLAANSHRHSGRLQGGAAARYDDLHDRARMGIPHPEFAAKFFGTLAHTANAYA